MRMACSKYWLGKAVGLEAVGLESVGFEAIGLETTSPMRKVDSKATSKSFINGTGDIVSIPSCQRVIVDMRRLLVPEDLFSLER